MTQRNLPGFAGMKVSHFGGTESVSSIEELRRILSERYANDANEFWLSDETKDFPCMAILVKGSLASVTFFEDEDDIGSQSAGRNNNLKAGTFTVFYTNTPNEEIEIHSEMVVSEEAAAKAAEQFFSERKMPRCMEWQKL